jgi:hypothetical protein
MDETNGGTEGGPLRNPPQQQCVDFRGHATGYERVLGVDHPDTLVSVDNLAQRRLGQIQIAGGGPNGLAFIKDEAHSAGF